MNISTPRDNNRKPTIMGTLNTDGATPVSIGVNPANHRLKASNGTTGSSFTSLNANRDNNRVTTLWGVSSADGITPTYIAVDSSGNILIKST
jgi:hypothetical protein